ncbi:hypothetical protein ACQKGA_23835 [Priestia megaterium]|uniref:hypothetical protein n=1 Tax=Priestia megaterium TaxID=1404 RepID=UPI0023D99B6F|nr:hypothetical protein [Priestia megaterium]MDF1964676.1 hypothetical protein [Priestia megaterium]
MGRNREETNSTSPVNLDEKEKKSFITSMMDASIIVLILTGLTYLIGMKFKTGYLGYYKVNTIMLSDVGMNYIINSVTGVVGLLMLWVVIFTFYLPALSSAKYISRILYFIMSLFRLYAFAFAFGIYVFDKAIDEKFAAIVLWVCIIILVPIEISNIFIKKRNKKKRNKKKSPLFEKFTNSIRSELNYIISDIKKNRYLKFIPLISCIFLAMFVFDNLGETSAQRRDEYLIIKYKIKDKKTEKIKETDFAVITEDKNNLLIAPVNIDKKVITPHYSIIEAKSKLNKLVKLEAMKFDGGLKVK